MEYRITGEIIDKRYKALLEIALKNSDAFSLSTFKSVHRKNLTETYFELLDALSTHEIETSHDWILSPHYESGQIIHVYSLNKATKKLLLSNNSLYSWRLPAYPEDLCFYLKKKAWLTSISHEKLCFLNDAPSEALRELESEGFELLQTGN